MLLPEIPSRLRTVVLTGTARKYYQDWPNLEKQWRDTRLKETLETEWPEIDAHGRCIRFDYTGRTVAFADQEEYALWLIERWRCRHNIYYLGKEVLGFSLFSNIHQDLADWLWATRDIEEQFLAMPRNTFKTSEGVITHDIWMIINDPGIRIAVLTGDLKLGRSMISLPIQSQILTNNKLKDLFPDVFFDSKSKYLVAQNDYFGMPRPEGDSRKTGMTLGLMAAKRGSTGFHSCFASIDDLVTKDNVASIEMQKDLKDVLTYLKYILDPPTNRWCKRMKLFSGTPYRGYDVYCSVVLPRVLTAQEYRLIREKDIFASIISDKAFIVPPYLQEKPNARRIFIFPERIDEAYIEKDKKESTDISVHYAQCLLKIVDTIDKVFPGVYELPRWTPETLPVPLNRLLCFDWAAEKEAQSKNKTVARCLGVDSLERVYDLGSVSGNWIIEDFADVLFQLFQRTHPKKATRVQISGEDIQLVRETIKKAIVKRFTKEGIGVSYEPVKRSGGSRTSKPDFINGQLRGLYQAGKFIPGPDSDLLLMQMDLWSSAGLEIDDEIDSLAIGTKSPYFRVPGALDALEQRAPTKKNPLAHNIEDYIKRPQNNFLREYRRDNEGRVLQKAGGIGIHRFKGENE